MRPGRDGVWGDLVMCIKGIEVHDHLQAFLPEPPARLLEVGAGCGKIGIYYANAGSQSILLDPDPEMRDYGGALLEAVRALARASGLQPDAIDARWVDGDARSLQFTDNSFDLVINEGLIEHWSREDQLRILGEMTRVSRTWVCLVFPDARIQVNWDVHAKIESNYHGFDHGHEKPLTPDEWRSLFNEAGLDVVVEQPTMGRLMTVLGRKRGALEVRG